MESKTIFTALGFGGHSEVGIVVHEGHEHSFGGSVVDPVAGRALLYSSANRPSILTSWDGTLEYPARFGAWHRCGFGYGTKRRHVTATILGQRWHGWEWSTHQIVRLRVSK